MLLTQMLSEPFVKGAVVRQKGIQRAHLSVDWQSLASIQQNGHWAPCPLQTFPEQSCRKPWEESLWSSSTRMSLEGREGMLASAIAWPSLNQYPTREQRASRSPSSRGSCGCVVTPDGQPGALPPLTHTAVQPSQVGGVCLCFNTCSCTSQPLDNLEISTKAGYYYHFSKASLKALSFAFSACKPFKQ